MIIIADDKKKVKLRKMKETDFEEFDSISDYAFLTAPHGSFSFGEF